MIGGKLTPKRRLTGNQAPFVKEHAGGTPFKVTMPAASYVTTRGYKPGTSEVAYPKRKDALDDVTRIIAAEVKALADEGVPKLPPVFAVAVGVKDGKPASAAAAIASAPATGMGGATGVPLAVGLATLRPDGELRRGVFAPEGIVDRRRFFELLGPLCTPAKRGMEDLVLVSRSGEGVE